MAHMSSTGAARIYHTGQRLEEEGISQPFRNRAVRKTRVFFLNTRNCGGRGGGTVHSLSLYASWDKSICSLMPLEMPIHWHSPEFSPLITAYHRQVFPGGQSIFAQLENKTTIILAIAASMFWLGVIFLGSEATDIQVRYSGGLSDFLLYLYLCAYALRAIHSALQVPPLWAP